MIKEKVEEVGVHFATRRSKRDKYLFVNRLAGKLQEAGRTLQIFQKNQESGEGRHLVSGKIGGGWIFAAAYDTGTKMLNPAYTYMPLDGKHNFHQEMLNVAIYSILSLLVAAGAVFVSKDFMTYGLGMKIGVVLLDLIAVYLILRWMKKPDNRMNMNRNSGSVAILYDCAEQSGKGCYAFLDHGIMNNAGFFEFAAQVQNQPVMVLDCLSDGEELFLAYKKGCEHKAKEAAAAFDLSVHLVPLTDEEYENTALAEFQNGYLLCSGSMKDNKILVKGARRSTDIEMDLGRMEKIEQGILKLS